VVVPAGLTRESPAAFGLALPGFVEPAGATVVDWLNRGLIVDLDMEVGLPSMAPEPSRLDRSPW